MRTRDVGDARTASGSNASTASSILIGLGLLAIGCYVGAAVARSREQQIRRDEPLAQAGRVWPTQSRDDRHAGSQSDDDEDDYLNQPTPHTM